MTRVSSHLSELYEQRSARFEAETARLGDRSRLVSNLRGLTFGIAVIAGLFAAFGSAPILSGALSALCSVAFIALVVSHSRVLLAEEDARRWACVNRRALARCTNCWQQLPGDGAEEKPASHPYAEDLDLFGPASLFQRLSVAHTRYGQRTLAKYLTEPASPATIRARQEAARALAPELELRQKLEALALALGDVSHQDLRSTAASEPGAEPDSAAAAPARARREVAPDPEPLLRWAESPPQLSERRVVKWLAWVIPPVTVCAILLAVLAPGISALVWALPLVAGILVNTSSREQTARVFGAVSSTEGAFLRYGAMLEVLEQIDLPAQFLSDLRQRVLSAEARPSAAMKRFRDLVGWFDLKHNGLIHPFVNALLLWDIHCVLRLEAWQRRVGCRARQWFDALGEFEALSSLAALAHDEPEFAFPEIVEDHAVFDAFELGHPLLDTTARVANDVTLEGPGSILLVTGSNMSGKSTLLRAMGLACVMALAGAPVCARRMRIARCTLRTSIRVSDSLESGISHFYAELRKLKAVLDATTGDAPVLFLLDEILHGTNSRERQIGAKWMLSELLRMGAIGAASTHDMGLTRLPETLADRVQLVHFRESIDAGAMTFDYRLRAGPVTAGNALRLMRLVGLDVPLE